MEVSGERQLQLSKLLKELLKPVEVKRIIIAKSNHYKIRGIVVTMCPVEKRESGKDFQVDFDEKDPTSIRRVVVDGRRLLLVKPRTPAKKHIV